MKQFLIKVVLFVVVLFVVDKIFIMVRNKAPEFDNDRRLEYVLDGKVNKEVIVFGSSRADADVATWLLESELGLDSYNLSYGGSEIELQTFILKQLLKNNQKPKLVIKVVDDDFELLYNSWNVFRTDRLLPLVKYPIIRDELVKRGEKNPIMSRLFVLNQLSLSNYDFRKPQKVNDTIKEFGSLPTNKLEDLNFEWNYGTNTSYDKKNEIETKVKNFLEFQELCQGNDIKLILTIPPSFKVLNTEFVERINDLKLNEVYFHVYDESKAVYKSKIYFNDRVHLNPKGAEIYTQDLIDFVIETKFVNKDEEF